MDFEQEAAILEADLVSPSLSNTYLLRFDATRNPWLLAQQALQSGLVAEAEPNYIRATQGLTPDDPNYVDQWETPFLQMPDAWEIETGDPSIIMAIVDTGADLDHVDLEPNIWSNPGEVPDNGLDDDANGFVDDVHGWDFVDASSLPGRGDFEDRDNDPSDETGHGTHVTGIAGARGNNGVGIAGVAWYCTLMPVRSGFAIIGGGTFLQDDDSAAGIIYAADNGAHIINMSWGDQINSFVIRDAVEYAYQKGCVLVAAAGNERSEAVLYPAALRQVISVSATDENDEHSYFANAGAGVDIAAPGSVVWSTHIDDRYRRESGTSMAAPHVVGAAALLLSKRPTLNSEDIRQILIATTDVLQESDKLVGAGRLNVARALATASAPAARFDIPVNGSGADESIAIIGTAAGVGFRSYELLYGVSAIPDSWWPVAPTLTNQQHHGSLALWSTAALDEGTYALRLEVTLDDGKRLRDQVVIHIDHTPPVIEATKVANWLQGDHYSSILFWLTDDVTRDKVWIRTKRGLDAFEPFHTESTSTAHLFALSNYLDSGEYEVMIESRNIAGLEAREDNGGDYFAATVSHERISPSGISSLASGLPSVHAAAGTTDYNENGLPEIIVMETGGSGYAPVTIQEYDDGWTDVFQMDGEFFPWAVGDLDGDGLQEVLGNIEENTFLLEPPYAGAFPDRRIWEAEDIWGGQFAQIGGRRYLVARNSRSDSIAIYRALADDQIELVAELLNPTDGRNDFVTDFAIADHDADGRTEIVAGDAEGDLLLYEHQGADEFELVWQIQFEGEAIQHLASGDTDADGIPEFVVGTRSKEDKFSLAREHWIYRVFARQANDDHNKVWEQVILQVRPGGNGMTVAPIDSQPGDEILIVTWPNAYLFSFRADTYAPIWHHTSESTFQPQVLDLNANDHREMLFNAEEGLQILEWREGAYSVIPWNLSAIPTDENRVQLSWQHVADTDSFTVYRGVDESHLVPIVRDLRQARYADTSVESDQTYWYAVAAVTLGGTETERSEAVEATPGPRPQLVNTEFLTSSWVILEFDQRMHGISQDIHNYQLAPAGTEDWVRPDSALLTQGEHSVQLRFASTDFIPDQEYELRVEWVYSDRKVLVEPNPTETAFRVPPLEEPSWTDLTQAIVYPNPVHPSKGHPGWVTFANLPTGTQIHVYTTQGTQLSQMEVLPSDRYQKRWQLDNGTREVASGVYTYLLEWQDHTRTGAIGVVW